MHPEHEPRLAAVVFDVDGTLCDVRAIRHLVEEVAVGQRSRDFRGFHDASINCPPHSQVAGLLRELKSSRFHVILATGREERWAFLTSMWLAERGIPYDELHMRPSRERRSDVAIKSDMIARISREFDVVLAVDDRQEILDVWQARGTSTAVVDAAGNVAWPEWAERGFRGKSGQKIELAYKRAMVGARATGLSEHDNLPCRIGSCE